MLRPCHVLVGDHVKSRWPATLSRFDNTTKIVLITFLARLYFYIHINTLYLQTRGLNLVEVNKGSIL